MSWYLSPSGWPTYAADGGLYAQQLVAEGYRSLDESQVAAAIAAFNGGTTPPAPPVYISTAGLDAAVAPLVTTGSSSTTAARLKAAIDAEAAVIAQAQAIAYSLVFGG